jgi:hypothetical protein
MLRQAETTHHARFVAEARNTRSPSALLLQVPRKPGGGSSRASRQLGVLTITASCLSTIGAVLPASLLAIERAAAIIGAT